MSSILSSVFRVIGSKDTAMRRNVFKMKNLIVYSHIFLLNISDGNLNFQSKFKMQKYIFFNMAGTITIIFFIIAKKLVAQKFGGNRQNGMKKFGGNRAQLRATGKKRGLYQRPVPQRGRGLRPRVYDDVFVRGKGGG